MDNEQRPRYRKSSFRLERQTPKALHQRVAEQLRAAIVAGDLPPGTHLGEAELAEMLGVSRSPIREALRVLEHGGLVVTYPFRGSFVLNASRDEIIALFLPLRLAVEQFAARILLSKDHVTIARELAATLDPLQQDERELDLATIAASDIAFHRLLCHRADHPLVAQLWNLIEPRLEVIIRAPYSRGTTPEHRQRVTTQHQAIIDALADGDERMILLLTDHITAGMQRDALAVQHQPETAAS
jgi:DNA-binding GntR family transcriptional regulator